MNYQKEFENFLHEELKEKNRPFSAINLNNFLYNEKLLFKIRNSWH